MYLLIFLVVSVVILIASIKLVPQHKRAIIERFGKYNRYLTPGLNFRIPVIEFLKARDIRSHTLDIQPQAVITKDNVEIMVDGIIWARPYDEVEAIKKTYYSIDNWKKAIQELAQTNLRQEFGALTLDESLTARATIASNLQKELDAITDEWGIKVDKVEIKSINPPVEITAAMHKQKEAEQNRRAAKIEATGRYEAAEQDKLAAIEIADGKAQAEVKIAEAKAKAIELVNTAAREHFEGNAVELKKLEVTENSLKNNAKIVVTEQGISPNLLIGNLTPGA